MDKSKVYFTDFRTGLGTPLTAKLQKLIKLAGIQSIDMDNKFVAIKMHFGELGNLAYLRPNYAKAVADVIKELGGMPFLTDCNTLYPGSRKHALEHMDCANINGFNTVTTGCQIIIADGLRGTDDIIVPTVEAPKPQAPIRMQPYDQTKDVIWLSKNYQVAIQRVADDSLRMVKDETGQKFVDNRITLKIIRADGSVFFARTFTKSAFDAQLDDDYRQTGILEGIVFDKVDGNNLVFAGSVSHPQTDEYIPLVITVGNFGDVTIKRDDQMDTSAVEKEDEEGV